MLFSFVASFTRELSIFRFQPRVVLRSQSLQMLWLDPVPSQNLDQPATPQEDRYYLNLHFIGIENSCALTVEMHALLPA